jgi:hypothetical protein
MPVAKCPEGFKVGADPELFIHDENGVPVSAAGLIPGTKATPYRVPYGAVQVDGMAAEFNIAPADTFQEFNRNICYVMDSLKNFLPEGYGFLQTPTVVFSDEVFSQTPDTAKELGCQPDMNAWTGDVNPPPEFLEQPTMRCAGGHLHFSWPRDTQDLNDVDHVLDCRDFVKQLDWYLGPWSVRMDKDINRRQLYGKAGAFRVKPYGVEYRTLSNFWIFNENRRLSVWNKSMYAIRDMKSNYVPESYESANELLIQSINTSTYAKELEMATGVSY